MWEICQVILKGLFEKNSLNFILTIVSGLKKV